MKSSTNRALVAKKQSTSFAQVATNLLNVLQGCSKSIRLLLIMFLTLTVSTNAWGQYTKASSIAVGDVVVLVYESGSTKKELNGISTTSTKYGIGESYSTTPAGRYELTVEAGSSTGTYSFKHSSGTYLYWSSGNSLNVNDTKNTNTSWTVTFSSGNAVIKNANDATRQIKWNTSSPRFACYTSGQSDVQLYKKAAYTVTATSNNNNYGTVSVSGTTITASPKTGYTYANPAYTVTSGTAIVTQNDNTFTVNPSTNCTVRINFEAKPKYTVTLEAGPGTCAASVTEPNAGAGVTLPAPTLDGCGDWEFAGWKTTSAVTTETTTEPTLIPAGAYSPTSNITLYAVYQRTEGGGGGGEASLTKMVAGNTLSDGDKIVVVANETSTAMYQETINSSYVNKWDCSTLTADVVADDDKNWWTVTMTTGGFYLGDATNGYLNMSSNNLYCNENKSVWTLLDLEDGTFKLQSNERNLSYRSDLNTNLYWRMGGASYGTTGQTILNLYKYTSGGGSTTTYYHSTPDCATPTPTPTLNVDPATLTFENTTTNTSTEKTFTLTGSDLTANAALALSGTNSGMFSVNPTSVTQSAGSINQTITVTYTPTAAGEHTATLTISSTDAESKTVTLSGTGVTPYTVTFNAGSGTCDDESLTETSGGAGVILPSANHPAACATDGWEFAGWWTGSVAETTTSPGELLTAGSNYKPASDCTLYAVYSYTEAGGGGSTDYVLTNIEDIAADDIVVITMTYTDGTVYALSSSNETSAAPEASTVTVSDNKLSAEPEDALKWNISNSSGTLTIYPNGMTEKWLYCTNSNDGVRIGTNDNKAFTIDATSGYLKNTNTNRYVGVYRTNPDWRCYENTTGNTANQTLGFYVKSSGGSTTTYNSNPACLEPVWKTNNAATIDKTSFTVNCGERSPMTSATNGAAIISFPTEDIYNFTKDITIEATTGFLVSTSQNEDAKYKSSVSLSPLVGTVNANTFYNKHVYVRAEAPAQSDTDLEGTITIKNNKGETLQTFSVTADVTCTQYTLTLVDRGVSTEQPTKYYAGETIDEAPADPEGVCTDPIHYLFDGWAEAEVSSDATSYSKVSFPYEVTGNTKFYAVYRYLEGGGNGDYNLVTSALDDWSGDYLIAYSDQIFANGTTSGESGIGAKDNKVDLSSNISNNTIPATVGDQYYVTLEAVTGGYVLKTQDGKYNYHTNNTGNGISASTIGYADDYPITVNFVSQEEINLCLGGSAAGSKFRYNTDGYFRFYKNGGQQPVYLYKKADGTTYYTTSPVCGPHLAITEGKEIYVTGGNAGGTRDLVIAQQKVSYKATRLEKDKSTGNLPSIKALPSNIVFDNTKTKAVAVTFDEDSVRTLQSDGTYTITGNITIAYQPAAANVTDDIQVTLNANYNPSADVSQASFTVHARSLPAEFVIVAKSGDKWYALNGDMNTNAANPANGQVTLDNDANPTKATYAPCNTIYTFDGLPNTGDRTYVRFQGTDDAWLWAASGTNVGIQNNVLKTTPEGNNNAYNWKLYTEDNITYRFGNANSNRQLTLSGEKFGMYASGVQDIRILPYEAKCLYNYAPTNLKVSVLKGTTVTLTWDAVAGATKYQYSTNATNWTDAGTDPTVTINGLTGATEYTYYIRAYHEDAGVSQECIDYAEITFTTANCDDVPTDITYTADMNSIIVSWIANAATSTVNLYSDEEAEVLVATQSVASPCTFTDLAKNTQYYVQILANGTCASPIVPVKTEDVEVDIVEWYPQGIIVDINTDETVGVTLENEVSYGSGMGTEATELFFSKYYEASYNVKLVAIYNGTKNIIDLTDYTIKYGKTSWESNYITLKDFGATKGQIQPGEEIILYTMQEGSEDDDIMNCVHEDFPDGNWVRVTSSNNDGKGTLSFGGDKTIILCKKEYDDEEDKYYDDIIDVIGALKNDPNEGILPTNEETKKPSWGDKEGWVCETGLSIADDSQIGISTNRCLLIRNNTVTSGDSAVTKNIGDFLTLCTEWKGAHVPDDPIDNGVQASCDNFAYVGTFDYSDYYTKYVPMGSEQVFDENARNADGTVTIEITDLYKHACSNIRVKLTNSNSDVLSDREYKVPIMITSGQTTAGQAFLDLQQNLATKEVDGEGNVIATHPLSLEEVREICKTCDVVVRNNATLTKAADGTTNDHPQVRNVYVYEGASIVIPDGDNHNYTINGLSLRRKGDVVASAQVQGTGKFVLPADEPVCLDLRVDANNWHWFTLPFDCDIADVTWIDGTPAKYNTDWFLMYYDGESRAASTNPHDNHWKVYNGTTIEAGKGYIVGITGDLTHPNYTFELRFPMAQGVLTEEQTDKTVPVNAWGVQSDNTPNNLGWNLVGNPYLNYYKTAADGYSLAGLPLIYYTNTDPVTGEWYYENSGSVPYVATPIDGGWYEYRQELASEVNMMPFTAYFVQVGDPETHTNGQALSASFEASNRGKKSIVRRAPREVEEIEEPIIVRVELTNSKGESDKTSLVIDDRFTNEYEMNGDFFKWFGDYYNYYTKPVLYTIGADQGKRAFNALNEELAKQPIPVGMYAAQAGNYTFSLNQQFDLSRVEEVWLYDATQSTYTNLMQSDYTFSTSKVNGAGRFSLSVKLAPKVATSIDNVTADKVWATTHTKQVIVNGLENGMHLWLYDATGKLLYNEPTSNYQHTYSVPQTGTYFVSVMKGNAKQTIKVVVE